MAGKGSIFVGRHAWKSATARLVLICTIYSMGSVFFGYDSSSFGGVQAFSVYIKQFGNYNASTKKYAIPAKTVSLMNSLPLIGKFLGSFAASPLIEKMGHRRVMIITCFTQIIGVIIQTTSKHVPQFIVGRMLIYLAVGLVENVVPTYQAELAPAPLRGFFVGSIQLFLTFGSLVAGIVNNYMAKYTAGSLLQLSKRFLPLSSCLACHLLQVRCLLRSLLMKLTEKLESPRWLLSKDRVEDAGKVLRTIRTKADVDGGLVELELAAMHEQNTAVHVKRPWIDLFRGTKLRRTLIASGIMALQQLTGVTFSSSYGPTFYKQVGLGSMAFTYTAINNGISVVTAMIGMIILDSFGRRSVSFWACILQTIFLCLIGGLGAKSHRTTSDTNGTVASFILYAAILHMSLGPAAYITASEIGTSTLREKTMAFSTAVNVVISFVVVFTTPYLLSAPYAALGAKLGYVWGGFAAAGAVWIWFFMPELKGRSLEEMDEIFDAKIPAWRFSSYKTSGISSDVAALQQHNDNAVVSKSAMMELDQVEHGDKPHGAQTTVNNVQS